MFIQNSGVILPRFTILKNSLNAKNDDQISFIQNVRKNEHNLAHKVNVNSYVGSLKSQGKNNNGSNFEMDVLCPKKQKDFNHNMTNVNDTEQKEKKKINNRLLYDRAIKINQIFIQDEMNKQGLLQSNLGCISEEVKNREKPKLNQII